MQESVQILCQLLSSSAAQRVLLLGDRAPALALELQSTTVLTISTESWQNLGTLPGRVAANNETAGFPPGNLAADQAGILAGFDLVYLTDLPAGLAVTPVSPELAQCLSALQSYCRGELLLEFTSRCGLDTDNQFFALGFSRVLLSKSNSANFALYRFSLHGYKTAPDWLNSKHWANPERWTLD